MVCTEDKMWNDNRLPALPSAQQRLASKYAQPDAEKGGSGKQNNVSKPNTGGVCLNCLIVFSGE